MAFLPPWLLPRSLRSRNFLLSSIALFFRSFSFSFSLVCVAFADDRHMNRQSYCYRRSNRTVFFVFVSHVAVCADASSNAFVSLFHHHSMTVSHRHSLLNELLKGKEVCRLKDLITFYFLDDGKGKIEAMILDIEECGRWKVIPLL